MSELQEEQEFDEKTEDTPRPSNITEAGGGHATGKVTMVTDPSAQGYVFVNPPSDGGGEEVPKVNERYIPTTYKQVIQYQSKENPDVVIDLHRNEKGDFDLEKIGKENLELVKNETGFDIEYETKEGMFHKEGPLRVGDYQDEAGNEHLVFYTRPGGSQDRWNRSMKNWVSNLDPKAKAIVEPMASRIIGHEDSVGDYVVQPKNVVTALMTEEQLAEWSASNMHYDFETYRRINDQVQLNATSGNVYQLPYDKTLGELDERYLPYGVKERFASDEGLYDTAMNQAVEARLVAERSLYAADFDYEKESKRAEKALAAYQKDLGKDPEDRSRKTKELEESAGKADLTVEDYIYRDFPKVRGDDGQVYRIEQRSDYEALVEESGFTKEAGVGTKEYLTNLIDLGPEERQSLNFGAVGLVPKEAAQKIIEGYDTFNEDSRLTANAYVSQYGGALQNETKADKKVRKEMLTEGGNLKDSKMQERVDVIAKESEMDNADQYYALREAMSEAIDDRVSRGDTDGLKMGFGAGILNWVSNVVTGIRDKITGADPSDPDYRRIPSFLNNMIANSVEKKAGIHQDFAEYSAELSTDELEKDLDAKRRFARDKLGVDPTKALADYKERHKEPATELAHDQPEDQPEIVDMEAEVVEAPVEQPVATDPNAPTVLLNEQGGANQRETQTQPLQEGLTASEREMVSETDQRMAREASHTKQVSQDKGVTGPEVG